jgi:hypothetical protein
MRGGRPIPAGTEIFTAVDAFFPKAMCDGNARNLWQPLLPIEA